MIRYARIILFGGCIKAFYRFFFVLFYAVALKITKSYVYNRFFFAEIIRVDKQLKRLFIRRLGFDGVIVINPHLQTRRRIFALYALFKPINRFFSVGSYAVIAARIRHTEIILRGGVSEFCGSLEKFQGGFLVLFES